MLNQLLASQIPEEIERAFDEASRTIDAQLTRLAQSISALDPTLEGAASSTQGRMRHDLETLHGKMIQAAKRRDETLRRQFTRARALAFPGGHAQERSIGFIAFLNQYGGALIDRLIALATKRYRGGITSYLDILVAQTALLTNQRAALNLLNRRINATVLLLKARGGGWGGNLSQAVP